MHSKTALVIGATGLIGGHLTEILLGDSSWDRVRLLVRRPITMTHPKLEVVVIDFSDEEAFRAGTAGVDAVFCAVGTTTRKVQGDRTAYRRVDYDIPVNAARFAHEGGASQFALVSSVGAMSNSKNFYLRLKGEAEEAIMELGYHTLLIMRPSLLLGDRKEPRPAERIAQWLMPLVSFLMPSRLKPIPAKTVAKAMVVAAGRELEGDHIFHYREMKNEE